jgi:hypothetical protein
MPVSERTQYIPRSRNEGLRQTCFAWVRFERILCRSRSANEEKSRMGADFNLEDFYFAVAAWAVATVAITLVLIHFVRVQAPIASPVCLAIVLVAWMAGCYIGCMLDDVLEDHPGNRWRIVAVFWYLTAAGSNPCAALGGGKPGIDLPIIGPLVWLATSFAISYSVVFIRWTRRK